MEPTEHFGIYFGYIRRLFQSWVSPFKVKPPAEFEIIAVVQPNADQDRPKNSCVVPRSTQLRQSTYRFLLFFLFSFCYQDWKVFYVYEAPFIRYVHEPIKLLRTYTPKLNYTAVVTREKQNSFLLP